MVTVKGAAITDESTVCRYLGCLTAHSLLSYFNYFCGLLLVLQQATLYSQSLRPVCLFVCLSSVYPVRHCIGLVCVSLYSTFTPQCKMILSVSAGRLP